METFCDHCDKYTDHECYTQGHERDSSWDWQKCKVCGWRYIGIAGKYEEP